MFPNFPYIQSGLVAGGHGQEGGGGLLHVASPPRVRVQGRHRPGGGSRSSKSTAARVRVRVGVRLEVRVFPPALCSGKHLLLGLILTAILRKISDLVRLVCCVSSWILVI